MTKIERALLAAAALAVIGIAPARADDAAQLQEMKDRAAIEALMWKYVRALDSLDADAYAAAFTADGEFGSGRNSEKGTAELKAMIDGLKKNNADRAAKGEPTPAMYHVVMNHTISFVDKDHARYDAYWTTMFAGAKQGDPARIAAIGRSVDMLVRQNGQWLIKTRDVAPK